MFHLPNNPLSFLTRHLRETRDFDAAALLTLQTMLDISTGILAQTPFASSGTIERATLHLRPSDHYVGLMGLRPHKNEPETVDNSSELISSATVWRWIKKHNRPLFLDILLAMVSTEDGEHVGDLPSATSNYNPHGSLQIYLSQNNITHILLLPLFSPGGSTIGMLSLEGRCQSATGTPFIWEECLPFLEAVSSIVAPILLDRPSRQTTPPSEYEDEYLPVIGKAMYETVRYLRGFSELPDTILLRGATGAGKSRLARWCHERSPKAGKPFETLNVLSVPEDLQAAQIFGWKKGAFTGADKNNKGALGRADGGTLFIDEIDKLSIQAQKSLLSLLEDGTYTPIGEDGRPSRANVRFIVGTNADLEEEVEKGRFKEDLFYRINVLASMIPPLKERTDEIPRWASFMLRRCIPKTRKFTLEEGAIAPLQQHLWPGNLRQLDNVLRRSYAFAHVDTGPQETLNIQKRHIQMALKNESMMLRRADLHKQLQNAAEQVSVLMQKYARKGKNMEDLDLQIFKGYVLAATVSMTGNLEDAFRALGMEKQVSSRNHTRTYKREVKRVKELFDAIGQPFHEDWFQR